MEFKFSHFLHVEDNEVSVRDADGNVVSSETYKTPKEAKEAFDEQMHELNVDESTRIEFVHYVPEFPPRRLEVRKEVLNAVN